MTLMTKPKQLATLIAMLLGLTSIAIAAPNTPTPSSNGIDTKQIQQLEQLQQANINNTVNSLPPDVQNQVRALQANQQSQMQTILSNNKAPAANATTDATLTNANNPNATATVKATATPTIDSVARPLGANNAQPAIPTFTEQDISDNAFKNVTQATLPMSSEQIQRLRQLFSQSQAAAATLPTTPPKPVATSQLVSLAPGATPPVIRLAQGFISSLVFVDSTGAPWPIEAYDLGNPSAFNVQWNKVDNTLMIQSIALYTFGNIAVKLRGLVTPVMLTLIPGQQAVDYRVDLRVQGLGPNANALPSGDGLPPATSNILLSVLDGVPPAGSSLLKLAGAEGQAWLFDNKLYIRTHLTLLSPAWLAMMTSADGTKAYEMSRTPTLLASDRGKVVQLKVEGL